MKDFSEKYLEIKKLMTDYHNSTLKRQWDNAHYISVAMAQASKELEQIAQKMLDDAKALNDRVLAQDQPS